MTRQCLNDGCTNPARPQRRTCNRCRARQWRERHQPGTWRTKDDLDIAAIVAEPRPAEGLTRLERLLIAQELTGRNMPARDIAHIVGVAPRTVARWRAQPPKSAA